MKLAIFSPFIGAVSETFITRHLHGLAPDNTVVVTGNIADQRFVQFPVLVIPYTEGPSCYTPEIEQQVVTFLREHQVTHILLQYGCFGTDIIELNARELKLPLFVHFHGGDSAEKLRNPSMLTFYRQMGQLVSGVCVVSEPMRRRLISIGIPKEKIFYTPYGVQIPNEKAVTVSKQHCKFLAVMRFVPKKAPLLLLESFLEVVKAEPQASLDIIGTGKLFEEAESFIQANRELHGKVTLHGAIPFDQIHQFFLDSSVFVQHSVVDHLTGDREGLPNALLEASSYGLPIVSTYHEGIPEAVKHEETGLLCHEGDKTGMTEHMLTLARDPGLRERLGNAARAHIEQHFSLSKTLKTLREVIDNKPVTFSEKETKTDKPLRFLQVHMFYDHYLGDFYRRYPQLVHAPFQEQIDALVKDGFSAIHILAPYMNEVGYDAQLIVGNNPVSQLQWLKEAGISEPTSGHWVKEIVREQIDKIKPDVLYLSEPILLDSSFIRTLSHRPKVILGWRAANIPSGTDWSEFDVILSCLSGIREAAKLLGAKDTAHFWPGFPSWIHDEIAAIQPSKALSFSGQWTENQHPARNRYLDTIARHAQNKGYDISLHLSGEVEKVTPSVKDFLAPPVYGIEMHRTLRQGKLAFDARGNIGLLDLPPEAQAKLGDLARNETANMRIIEATGSGVFLLTEEKENLSELYEPGKEIVTFSSESDLLEKIDYYLTHDYEREAIMQAALTRCKKEHSMDQCSRKLDAIIKKKLGREEVSRKKKGESSSATTPQTPTKKFLISGIAPHEYGTGKLYASLIPHAQAQGYTVIHPMPGKILHDDISLNFDSISDSTVFLLHPQSIGLEKVLGLLRRNNDVRMYVLDSSFFCIQSYNHREEIRGECLDCLGSTSQCHSACVPYPVKYDKQLNLSFLEELREHAAHITFYCQTESQKQLILKHFENVRDAQVVGMLTQEYEISPDTIAPPEQQFDIVFHADPLPAKGVEYALLLSFYLGDLSVLFPFDRNYLTTMVPHAKVPANATIQPMRWESGLMNAVTHAKAVLCPSLWSAPVEGALMKSLYFNGNVAVFDTEYGFHKEIPLDHVTKLGKDIFKASKIFRDSLSLDKEKRLASRQWVENYNNAINFKKLFV